MMFIDEGGSLLIVNVNKDHSGHYQCQTNDHQKFCPSKISSYTVLIPSDSIKICLHI